MGNRNRSRHSVATEKLHASLNLTKKVRLIVHLSVMSVFSKDACDHTL